MSLKAGGFYRLLNYQDSFLRHQPRQRQRSAGYATLKLDQRTRMFIEYGLDTDFPIYRPDIQNTQTFRLGMAWKY